MGQLAATAGWSGLIKEGVLNGNVDGGCILIGELLYFGTDSLLCMQLYDLLIV